MVQAIRPHSDRAGRPLVSPSPLIGGAVSGGAIDEQTAAATATDRPVATAFAHAKAPAKHKAVTQMPQRQQLFLKHLHKENFLHQSL